MRKKLIWASIGGLIQWVASTKEGKDFANLAVEKAYKLAKEKINEQVSKKKGKKDVKTEEKAKTY